MEDDGASAHDGASGHRHHHRHPHHHHHHGHGTVEISGRVERRLWWVVACWMAAVLVGLALLWPGDTDRISLGSETRVSGTVERVDIGPCTGTSVDQLIECRFATVRVDGGDLTVLEQAVSATPGKVPEVGDRVRLIVQTGAAGATSYLFADYERSGALWMLAVLFAVAVLVLGRWRGLGALAWLALSVVVLVVFALPALLDGGSPVAVAIVAASLIAMISLYLAHGIGSATNVALLSTLAALTLTGVLAWLFVRITSLTGLTDESSFFLEALGVNIDPRGLLLAGVVIGSLGVLDDVTVTQVLAVGELARANPSWTSGDLYRSAVTIGRDHISSTVNTLFLAYAGASLPLLLLFTQTDAGLGDAATREVVAVEIVRTLVGSIGLVASVPIATGLAVTVVRGRTRVEPLS